MNLQGSNRIRPVTVTLEMQVTAFMLATLGMLTAIGGLVFFVLKIVPTL